MKLGMDSLVTVYLCIYGWSIFPIGSHGDILIKNARRDSLALGSVLLLEEAMSMTQSGCMSEVLTMTASSTAWYQGWSIDFSENILGWTEYPEHWGRCSIEKKGMENLVTQYLRTAKEYFSSQCSGQADCSFGHNFLFIAAPRSSSPWGYWRRI
jgi:hypothetical protein